MIVAASLSRPMGPRSSTSCLLAASMESPRSKGTLPESQSLRPSREHPPRVEHLIPRHHALPRQNAPHVNQPRRRAGVIHRRHQSYKRIRGDPLPTSLLTPGQTTPVLTGYAVNADANVQNHRHHCLLQLGCSCYEDDDKPGKLATLPISTRGKHTHVRDVKETAWLSHDGTMGRSQLDKTLGHVTNAEEPCVGC
ncbi:hypothetical protein BJV74DRAFT_819197 [Russula compacta]|nr:hypothetical protein BJV74DRAFT_819197 [Russula compacta]